MRWLRKNGLQHKITALCIAIAVLAVLFVGISQYTVVPRMLQEKASDITQRSLETIAVSLEQRINSIIAFASTFASNAEINSALTRSGSHYTPGDAALISTVFRLVTVTQENLIDSILVYTDAGKLFVGGNGGYLSRQIIESRFSSMEEELARSNWVIRYEPAPMRNYENMPNVPNMVSLYYILRDTVSLNRLGAMYIGLNPDVLLSFKEGDPDSAIFLVDENGIIISGSRAPALPAALQEQIALHTVDSSGSFLFKDGSETEFAVYTRTMNSGWRLMELLPYRSLVGDARNFVMILFYILIAAFAAVILLTIYGTRKSLAPLRRLRDSMLAVQEGNYDVQVKVETDDEIGQLARTYNLMLSQIKQLIQEIYASEKQKRDIELQVLQMQINPHFLYNTLNSIHWMAVMHGLDSISNMVDALVAILRHSLQDFHEFTTLQEELETLKQYLFIQNVRFNNGISLDAELPPGLGDRKIPRLLLQPLVENAILHGIRPRGGKGHIRVTSSSSRGLTIEVTDDGVGFPESIPDYVPFDRLEGTLPASGASFSIGLKNTHERIRLQFGPPFGLFIRSIPGQGTTIRIVLPDSGTETREQETRKIGEGAEQP